MNFNVSNDSPPREILKKYFVDFDWDSSEQALTQAEFLKDTVWVIATEDDQIRAFTALTISSELPPPSKLAILTHFIVPGEFQRRGFGRLLMSEVERLCSERLISYISLHKAEGRGVRT